MKRLKEERMGFDNQLAGIERTLKAFFIGRCLESDIERYPDRPGKIWSMIPSFT